MGELLLWLWDVAVEPVLEELQFDAVDDGLGNLPRIWWIGVGALAMAPFHAAGDHSPGSTRNTLSRAISSYIPTIKALSYARQKKLDLFSKPNSSLLLVTMPTTPGHMPLKNATKEVEEISRVVKGRISQLNSPSVTDVLELLPSYDAIHFACHGMSDGKNPSNSHLLLRQDAALGSGAVDKLTVGAISNLNIKNAQLSYLSACCTAANPSAELADESIHIASGFQLVGFSHVLATMWESNDFSCQQVARDFYSLLYGICGQGHEREHRAVSAAFHQATRKLRGQNLGQPIVWTSFIHTGA